MSVPDIPSKTQVCIIGAGPAGVIAAYLFALRGVSVVLLGISGTDIIFPLIYIIFY